MADDAQSLVNHVRRQLADYTVESPVDEHTDPRIHQSIEWLISSQLSSGGFGNDSPAYSAIAVKTIRTWRPAWVETDEFSRAASHIMSSAPAGRMETVWDTAMAVIALHESRISAVREWVDRATNYLALITPDPHLKPHHAAQLVITLTSTQPNSSNISLWVSLLQIHRIHPATPYCLGQVSSALSIALDASTDFRLQCDELAAWLGSVDVTKANFVEYCSALIGLSGSTHPAHAARVAACIDDLFNDGRRLDGSWYHDSWETSWALAALRLASARQAVTLPVHDLALILEEAEDLAQNLESVYVKQYNSINTGYFWRTLTYSQVLLILTGLAIYGLFLSKDSGWYIGYISLVLVPGIATVRQLWQLHSRVANRDL